MKIVLVTQITLLQKRSHTSKIEQTNPKKE